MTKPEGCNFPLLVCLLARCLFAPSEVAQSKTIKSVAVFETMDEMLNVSQTSCFCLDIRIFLIRPLPEV